MAYRVPLREIRPSNVDSVRVIQVIEVKSTYGEGERLSDPIRGIREYYSLDGELLARVDDWKPEGDLGDM